MIIIKISPNATKSIIKNESIQNGIINITFFNPININNNNPAADARFPKIFPVLRKKNLPPKKYPAINKINQRTGKILNSKRLVSKKGIIPIKKPNTRIIKYGTTQTNT